MACKLPVVATCGVNKIIIKNDHNGLLVKNNKDWVEKILNLKMTQNYTIKLHLMDIIQLKKILIYKIGKKIFKNNRYDF